MNRTIQDADAAVRRVIAAMAAITERESRVPAAASWRFRGTKLAEFTG